MRNPLGGGNGLVAHYSGTTLGASRACFSDFPNEVFLILDAQKRYADGTKEISKPES